MVFRALQFFLLSLFLLVALAGWAAEPITQDGALVRGQEFAQAVGWVKAEEAVESYFIPPELSGTWGVKIVRHTPAGDEGMPMAIDQASGQIIRATNNGALKRLAGAAKNITSAQAAAAAVKALVAAGLPREQWKVDARKLERRSSGDRWNISFRHVYGGYPFQYDRLVVMLDPRDGTLLTLDWQNRSPLPESVAAKITRDAAVQTARTRLAAAKFTLTRLDSARLLLVKVKDYSAAGTPNRTRLAWVVRCVSARKVFYTYRSSGPLGRKRPPYDPHHPKTGLEEEIAEMWIDAENGAVLRDFRYRGTIHWLK